MSRVDDLRRVREVLFMALDGDRQLQRGEQSAFSEAAAGLVRELRAVIRELEELSAGSAEEVPTVDEIAARRSARLAGTDDSAQPSRRGQPRRGGGSNRTG